MAFNDIYTVLKNNPLPSDEEINMIPSFMFCRYLSGSPVTIGAANIFNTYHKEIPMLNQYKMIKLAFGGRKIFPRSLKKLPKEEQYDGICQYYKVSRERAREYREYMSTEEFSRINKLYEIKG